jgi:ATP-dependent helicase IRC3
MIKPYPYQQDMLAAIVDGYKRGLRRVGGVLATGGGKTVVFSSLATMSLDAGRPVLVLAHRTELIEQAADKMRQINPGARIGIFKGGVKQWRADVVVASVQTAYRPAALALLKAAGFGLVIIDEVHHGVADTYMKTVRELGAYAEGGPLLLGVTATMDRADGVALGLLIEEVVYKRGMVELIKDGYLVPPRGVRVRIAGLDMSKVRSIAGDLDQHAVAAAMHDALAPAAIARAYLEHAAGRSAIAFLPSVDLSIEQAEAFNAHGIPALHVDGKTPDGERDLALKRHRAGEVKVLCNVGLFTEGTDLPYVSCIILGRPTKSASLYTQMVGRGVRLAPGKKDCVILDVVGVTGKHRLATLANLDGADRVEELDDELSLYEEDWTDEVQLAEPEAEPAAEHEPERSDGVDGPLEAELVDLFGSAHAAWLRTAGGTFFLAAGPQHLVYLAQRGDGSCDVKAVTRQATATTPTVLLAERMEIGYAMAWGEDYVERTPMWGLGKDAKWRQGKPARGLVNQARGLRIDTAGRTRGELSDAVAVAEASRLLDG